MTRPRILVIDDSPAIRDGLDHFFAVHGYTLVYHDAAATALPVVRLQQPDLVIVDLNLEYADAGLDIVRAVRADPSTVMLPIVVWSTDPDLGAKLQRAGYVDVPALSKFDEPSRILAVVRHAVQRADRPLGA